MGEEKKIPLTEYSERVSARMEHELLPEFTAELDEIRTNGISVPLIYKIIEKHISNADYNRRLYKRYMGLADGIPIFSRQPRYDEEKPINNKVNNDFFGEIVDFKVGYFAGEPITYSYSATDESEDSTGGEVGVDKAIKALTDFTTRNNMYGVDIETTKYASIYGYSGRLFYIDKEMDIRVMPVHGYETIILSDTDISEPEYAIRYYKSFDINGAEIWTVEFYDEKYRTVYTGGSTMSLTEKEKKEHQFDYCPLQGIANNKECIGDAEKVLALIDDYDKVVSDNSNEIESFAHALMQIGVNVDDSVIQKAQKSGVLIVPQVGSNAVSEPVKWVTKNINDTFTEHHLERLEDNIYRFSRTPNLGDETFGNATGVALKFKLHGLETKCAAFEANVMNAAQHMWRVLCSAWRRKGITVDPLQCCMECHRNFPQDQLSQAQTAQAFISAGLPKEWVYSQIPGIDDVDYVMEMIKQEKESTMELYPNLQNANESNIEDDEDAENNDTDSVAGAQ